MDEYFDDDEFIDPDEADIPFWTPPRVVYLIVIMVTLLAFLLYTIAPTIRAATNPPPPPPITAPTDRV